jgi:hypothetical protein
MIKGAQQKYSGSKSEDKQHECNSDDDVELAQKLNTLVDTGSSRQDGNRHDNDHDNDLANKTFAIHWSPTSHTTVQIDEYPVLYTAQECRSQLGKEAGQERDGMDKDQARYHNPIFKSSGQVFGAAHCISCFLCGLQMYMIRCSQ